MTESSAPAEVGAVVEPDEVGGGDGDPAQPAAERHARELGERPRPDVRGGARREEEQRARGAERRRRAPRARRAAPAGMRAAAVQVGAGGGELERDEHGRDRPDQRVDLDPHEPERRGERLEVAQRRGEQRGDDDGHGGDGDARAHPRVLPRAPEDQHAGGPERGADERGAERRVDRPGEERRRHDRRGGRPGCRRAGPGSAAATSRRRMPRERRRVGWACTRRRPAPAAHSPARP